MRLWGIANPDSEVFLNQPRSFRVEEIVQQEILVELVVKFVEIHS